MRLLAGAVTRTSETTRMRAFSDPPNPDIRPTTAVRLTFDPTVPISEVAGTLELALLAAESLHGADRVQLDAAWAFDPDSRRVAIDTSRRLGHTLALVFLGYVKREFGGRAVRVERLAPSGSGLGRQASRKNRGER